MDEPSVTGKKPFHLIWSGILFGFLYWIFESIRHFINSGEGSIFEIIFIPDPREFWMRILVVFILLLFGVMSYSFQKKLNQKQYKMHDVPGRAEVMIMCAGFGLLYWVLESIRDVVVFDRGSLLQRLLLPDSMSVWMRILPILVVVLFGIYFNTLLDERKRMLAEQQQKEAGMSEKDREFLALKELITIGLFKVTRKGHFIDVNNAFVAIFGYKHKSDVLSLHTSDLFHDPENRLDLDSNLRKLGEVKELEYLMKKRNGKPLWISVSAIAVRDNSGEVLYYEGMVEDITGRKEMALEIERRKSYLESVVKQAPVGIVTLDRNHRIIDWNGGAETIFGYTRDEVMGKDIDDLISNNGNLDECRAMARRVLDGEVLTSVETVRYRKDREPVSVLCSGSPIYVDNELHGIVAVYEDISKTLRVENALKNSEEKYRLLTESTSDVIWSFTLEGETTYVSPSVENLLGYTPEEAQGLKAADIAGSDDLKTAERILAEELARENGAGKDPIRSHTVEVELIRKNGGGVWTEATASFLRNDLGMPIGILMVFRDINRRRQADSELKRLNRALKTLSAGNKALVRASNSNVLLQDICTILVESGGYAMAWAGITPDASMSRIQPEALAVSPGAGLKRQYTLADFNDTLGSAILDKLREMDACIEENSEDGLTRIILPLHNGGNIYGALCIYSAQDPAFDREEAALLKEMAGDLAFGISVLHDRKAQRRVAEEKDAIQQQLLQAQKMEAIGVLTGGIAHDFNNLLTAIIGCSDMALMDVKEDDPVHRELLDIQSAANKAAQLTGQLLLFSRKQPMKFETIDLKMVIGDLKKLLTRLLGENISIETSFPADLWHLFADKGSLEQVLMNLSVNARDAMPDGGKITFNVKNVTLDKKDCYGMPESRPGKYIRLSVADTGTGMSDQVKQQIFDPFFSTKGKSKGTGLGLSVVYGIIKQHEGWIQVFSEQHKGSEFVIYLPAVDKPKSKKSDVPAAVTNHDGKGRRILIVEDEDKVREFTINGLNRIGYTVFAASSADEAKQLFEREKGDFYLVISDVGLPGQSGIELVNELVEKKPKLKVLLSSGYSDHRQRWPLIKKKGYRFLEKPYAFNDLVLELHSLNA
ncbi:PAS domain S-box protein [bacterium]|nr:PAS domain S-box protein [bacterium]